jgi:hypothetical protein
MTPARVEKLNAADRAKARRMGEQARSLRREATALDAHAAKILQGIARRNTRAQKAAVRKTRARVPAIDMRAVRSWYRQLYGEPWPEGWTVEWVPFIRGCHGLCLYGKKLIKLSWWDLGPSDRYPKRHPADAVETLIHEIVHMRFGHKLRHGREFTRLVRQAYLRAGGRVDDGVCPQTREEKIARGREVAARIEREVAA